MAVEQTTAMLRRRSSMDLITVSEDFKHSIANLSIGQSLSSTDPRPDKSAKYRMNELVKCEVGDQRARDVFVGRRRSSVDLPVLPIAAARRNIADLRVDKKYADCQTVEDTESASLTNATPRRRRGSVDCGSLHHLCEVGPLLQRCESSTSLIKTDVEQKVTDVAIRDRLFTDHGDFHKPRRHSAPMLDFGDVRVLTEKQTKYADVRKTSGKGSEENQVKSEKWLKFMDKIKKEKTEEEKQRESSATSEGFLLRRSKSTASLRCQMPKLFRHQHSSGCIDSKTCVVNMGSGVSEDATDHQLSPRPVVEGGAVLNSGLNVTKDYLVSANSSPNMCSFFTSLRSGQATGASHANIQPGQGSKPRGGSELIRSRFFGGKHTRERQSKRQNCAKQIKQYLQALEEELPTQVLLEIKRLREENNIIV